MTTHTVSFSELDAIRQCRLKSFLGYRERWQPEEISPALRRGKLFHAVMEARNNDKVAQGTRASAQTSASDASWEAAKRAFLNRAPTPHEILNEAGESDEVETVRWMLEGYDEYYGETPEWEILAVEQRVEEWLPLPNGKRSQFKMKGFVDLLIRDHSAGGGIFGVDYKSCRELPKQKQYDFDDQSGIYTWLLRKQGINVRGFIFDACRTARLKRPMELKERFKRELTVRSDRELETMVAEALATFKSAYAKLPEGALPPRSPDPDRCGWRCPFTEACLMSRKGKAIRPLLEDFGFKQNMERH
jgi:hypothetical protein